jgi:hypothetical protein
VESEYCGSVYVLRARKPESTISAVTPATLDSEAFFLILLVNTLHFFPTLAAISTSSIDFNPGKTAYMSCARTNLRALRTIEGVFCQVFFSEQSTPSVRCVGKARL